MMRYFKNLTRGVIFEELENEGLKFNNSQFRRFEKKGIIPKPRRTGGKWRIYTREEVNKIKEIIWKYYGGLDLLGYKMPEL